jgi:hypothetical protein
MSITKRISIIEKFINTPLKKNVIISKNLIEKYDQGDIINAAIINNPNNLVFGLVQSLRLNNYKGKIDKELLLNQNNNFQKAVKIFVNNRSLANFANILYAESVDWVIANKKYFLKKSFMSKLSYFFQILYTCIYKFFIFKFFYI